MRSELEDFNAERDLITLTFDALEQGHSDGHHAITTFRPEMMLDMNAKAIWTAMQTVYRRGEFPDHQLVRAELAKMGKVGDSRDWITFHIYFQEGATFGSPAPIVEQLTELWQRRVCGAAMDRAARSMRDLMEDHQAVIQEAISKVLDSLAGDGEDSAPAGDAIMELVEQGRRFAIDEDSGKVAWTGLDRIDDEVRCEPGEFVIIAARPGAGKTTLGIQTLVTTALHEQEALFVSLELPRVEALARLAAHASTTRAGRLWAGNYSDRTKTKLAEQRAILNRVHVWAPDIKPSWSRIEAKIRGAVIRKKVKVVVLDYFGLIGRPEMKKGVSPFQVAADLSGSIRSLAKELKICFVVICQLNREGAEGEPSMEHLRETGQLEQDAQVILGLWRAKAEKEVDDDPFGTGHALPLDPSKPKATYLKVLKNRNGAGDLRLQLHFDGAVNRMVENIQTTS